MPSIPLHPIQSNFGWRDTFARFRQARDLRVGKGIGWSHPARTQHPTHSLARSSSRLIQHEQTRKRVECMHPSTTAHLLKKIPLPLCWCDNSHSTEVTYTPVWYPLLPPRSSRSLAVVVLFFRYHTTRSPQILWLPRSDHTTFPRSPSRTRSLHCFALAPRRQGTVYADSP